MAAPLARLLPAPRPGAVYETAVPDPSGARDRFAVPTRIRMPFASARARAGGIVAFLVAAVVLLGTALTGSSAGDLQSRIAAGKSAAASLSAQIAADTAQIRQTSRGLADANQRLAVLQDRLTAREVQLRTVQSQLLTARNHLVDLENQLQRATRALSENLVASYEQEQPNLVTVILEAHGFTQLIERVNFMHRVAEQNARTVAWTRAARAAVARQARLLATLERRDQTLTAQVLAQRNSVAALRAALLSRQISERSSRNRDASKLHALKARLASLEAKAAAEAARAAATGNASVGGVAVDTGGMVQAPPGAPAAVAQVIAAGNAIATLPYVYGGGHASFRADGYDCSGSVSYALAAAGLVSSPMVSGAFENWGDPGPGRWITLYANAGHVWMEVAGWRFDTVALAEGGTRWSRGGGEFSGFVVRHPPGL
jgi:cell wall-associated NlpC family hydrolase